MEKGHFFMKKEHQKLMGIYLSGARPLALLSSPKRPPPPTPAHPLPPTSPGSASMKVLTSYTWIYYDLKGDKMM